MNVDVDQLTEAELRDLNHKIVARLRLLYQMRTHAQMMEFKIGDRVSFEATDGHTVTGVITKYNRKTVTVVPDCGHHWTVSPGLLRLAGATPNTGSGKPNANPSNRQ